MRPTQLNFRSPKETTPDAYDVKVAVNGTRLSYTQHSFSFTHSRRFSQYDEWARRNQQVGPGSYNKKNATIGFEKIRHTPVFRRPIQTARKACLYVGNHLIPEGSLLSFAKQTICRAASRASPEPSPQLTRKLVPPRSVSAGRRTSSPAKRFLNSPYLRSPKPGRKGTGKLPAAE